MLQVALNLHCDRMRATEHAPRGWFNLLERPHALAEIVERSAGVLVSGELLDIQNLFFKP